MILVNTLDNFPSKCQPQNLDSTSYSKRSFVLFLATGSILLIAWFGNQLIESWNWDETDFIVIGVMILITGHMIEVMIEKIKSRRRALIVTALILLVFLWLWAELAVGIFTSWGS